MSGGLVYFFPPTPPPPIRFLLYVTCMRACTHVYIRREFFPANPPELHEKEETKKRTLYKQCIAKWTVGRIVFSLANSLSLCVRCDCAPSLAFKVILNQTIYISDVDGPADLSDDGFPFKATRPHFIYFRGNRSKRFSLHLISFRLLFAKKEKIFEKKKQRRKDHNRPQYRARRYHY